MTLVPVSPTTVTALWTWLELSVVLAVPFHFAGVVISLALTRSPFPVGRTYAADMQGAGLGCLGVLVLLSKTDAPSAVIWVGVIGAIAAWSFAGSGVGTVSGEALPFDWLLKRRKSIIGLLVLAAIANGVSDRGLQPTSTNSKLEQPASYLFREWNSLSRIAVHKELFAPPFLWGGSPTLPTDWYVNQHFLDIDGFAGTPAYEFNGELDSGEYLRYDVTNLAYFLPHRERVAVIGVGGGRDLLAAAHFGRRDITGIELNPIFVKLHISEPVIAEFSLVARLAGVRFVVDEARSWMARRTDNFDLIQMSLIDPWAPPTRGPSL